MTTWEDVQDNKMARKVLDKGFVVLVDTMGSDAEIAKTARTSYGLGTKSVSDDENLINYLIKHHHSSPLEFGEVKFLIKIPIAILAQLQRHRTASINQLSARYSIIPDDFYIPDHDHICEQSNTNKQSSGNPISNNMANSVQWIFNAASQTNYELYKCLLNDYPNKNNAPYDVFNEDMLSKDFTGISRETARFILPQNMYTQLYWKMDLNNLFKTLKSRMALDAQSEIRDYANAIYELVQQHFPLCCAAFTEHDLKATKYSYGEHNLLCEFVDVEKLNEKLNILETNADLRSMYNMSKRDVKELKNKFALNKKSSVFNNIFRYFALK